MRLDGNNLAFFVSIILFLNLLTSCYQKSRERIISDSYLIYDTLYGGEYYEKYPETINDNPRVSLYSDSDRNLKIEYLSRDTIYRIYFSLHKYDSAPLEWIKINSKEISASELNNYYFDISTIGVKDSIKVNVCFKQNNITIIGECTSMDCSNGTFDTTKLHSIIVEEYLSLN